MHAAGEKTNAYTGAAKYLARLEAELGITERQAGAWAAYVAALQSNRHRMEGALGADAPFGGLTDRLAALAAMRRATARLCACLNGSQRERVGMLIPLCCQPVALEAVG
jgi:hypothetical protein